MPHSSHLPLSLALDHVVRLQPTSVLDIGLGFGKWGYLTREALDFMEGRLDQRLWRTRIIGIDVKVQGSPLWQWVYDEVIVGDAFEMLDRLSGFDLVILGDVIEHLTKVRGQKLLSQLVSSNRNVLVVTPIDFFEQDMPDNVHERHLSLWTRLDFSAWNYDYDVVGGTELVALLAGIECTYPTARTKLRSRLAYSMPGMRRRSGMPQMVKKVLVPVLGR